MNLRYMAKELYYQRRRTLMSILGLSIGIALLIILNSLSSAYRQAAHVPLQEIGADITVQRAGDVPKDLAFFALLSQKEGSSKTANRRPLSNRPMPGNLGSN